MGISRDGAVLSVMVLMSLVDTRLSEAEVVRIRWIFEKLTGRSLGDEDVWMVAQQVRADATDLDAYLADLGQRLEIADRRTVFKAAFGIATADGKVVDEEDALMQRVGKALRFEPAEYNAIARHLKSARELV
jgi:uncharacterized tellurite resistance protein B-like protein